MSKDTVLQALSTLPAEVTIDDVVERLIFIEKVEEGLAQLDRGESKTQEEVEQLVIPFTERSATRRDES